MDFSDLQKQYIDSLGSFFSFSNKPQNPWQEAMDYWWQSNSPVMPSQQSDVFSKVMEQGKSFYYLAEQLSNLLNLIAAHKKNKKQWADMLDQQIELMKQVYNQQSSSYQEELSQEWATVENLWQSLIKFMPGFETLLKDDLSDSQIKDAIEKYLSMPGLGLNRELQGKIQQAVLSYKRLHETNRIYNEAMSAVASKGMDLLKEKIILLSEKKEKIGSLKEVYDLWVDCNEDVYGEYVLSKDYSELYGKLVNALLRFKVDVTELIGEMQNDYNIVSKNEFNQLAKQQHQLKRQLKIAEQKSAQEQDKINQLEQEVQTLKDIVSKITNDNVVKTNKKKSTAKRVSTTKKKTVVAKKTASRKKRVTKKKLSSNARTTTKKKSNIIELKF